MLAGLCPFLPDLFLNDDFHLLQFSQIEIAFLGKEGYKPLWGITKIILNKCFEVILEIPVPAYHWIILMGFAICPVCYKSFFYKHPDNC